MKLHILVVISLFAGTMANGQSNKMDLGNLKVNHNRAQIEEIRDFYRNVLGAEIINPKSASRDYIQFSNGFRINIIYTTENHAPTADEFLKGIWVRIHVSDFGKRYDRVLTSGVKIINYKPLEKELYFQAVGGIVFRMSGSD